MTFLFLACKISFCQTQKDTVKTGKTNDPMIVNPGKGNDGMAVKPSATNDGMSVMSDTAFINKNIMDNMMEIQLSKMGLNKGTSPQVKKAAAVMITDHTAILNDLKKLAAKKQSGFTGNQMKGMAMPSINMQKGQDFNQAWATQMLTMHETKIAELESFIGLTQDTELKAAAIKALPKIKMHKDLLLKIPGVKAKSSTSQTI